MGNIRSHRSALLGAAIAACLMASVPVHAAQTNTGCQGNCAGGDTTNNTYNQGGAGGVGGQGGQGGAGFGGTGVGVGTGGSASVGDIRNTNTANGGNVLGSGNSANDIRNTNTANGGAGGNATQGQQQGQLQGQQQGQAQNSNNRNDNQSNASNRNSNAAQGNTTSTSVSVAGDNITYEAAKIPVATAYAPNIVATALCKFGVSGGGQGMTFGFSVGVSITDENCMLLEQVRTVSVILGDKETAAEMMMAVPAYAEAVKRRKGGATAAAVDVKPAAAVSKAGYNEQDPIIRSRLGLPPLSK